MKIVHTFVDESGKTHVDEISSNLPLDMGAIPEEYHVFLFTRHNARMIAERIRECDDGKYRRRVFLCCPTEILPVREFDDAKYAVRRYCFEGPPAVKGGLRSARMTDYVTARIVSLYDDVHKAMLEQMKLAKGKSPSEQMVMYQQAYSSIDPGVLHATTSAHPLWKRVSWIHDFKPPLLFNLMGELVDPTWYVNVDDPRRSGVFKARCGLYNARQALLGKHLSTPVWLGLMAPFSRTIERTNSLSMDDLTQPDRFFCRHGLRWLQHYLDAGESKEDAVFGAAWHHAEKLANYLWLNWMEVTHESPPQHFDDRSFFGSDTDAADAAYKAACS